jgi:2-desacetyl-2-hydroxyethyl bacteriochlorophyllide A dehydrogenase
MFQPLKARQFRIPVPGRGEIVDTALPARRDDDVLVRTLYSGVSRGTESLVFRGEVPPSQYHAMRAPFQMGDFPGPVAYGYMSVGVVAEARAGSDLLGRTVFCLYPHQDRYVVPATAVTPLPDGIPASRAVLAANVETAVNVVWDAAPSVGDRVLIVGGGVVGLLVAWLVRRIPGTEVTLVDVNPARATAADALGVPFATTPPGAEADLVVHASGDPGGLRTALAAAGPEALVVEASWYGDRSVPLPLGEAFHARRLTLRSSQVGHVPPQRVPRWTHGRRMALALSLLADPALDVLINDECAFDALPEAMEALSERSGDTLCLRVRYPEAAGC